MLHSMFSLLKLAMLSCVNVMFHSLLWQIVIPLLILFFSSQEIYKQKPNLSPVKSLKRANTTPIKRSVISGHDSFHIFENFVLGS